MPMNDRRPALPLAVFVLAFSAAVAPPAPAEKPDVGFLDLPAEDAVINGGGAELEGRYMAKISGWKDVDTTLEWEVEVPEVLRSGDHGAIASWRRRQALLRTARKRPDLLKKQEISEEEAAWVARQLADAPEENG